MLVMVIQVNPTIDFSTLLFSFERPSKRGQSPCGDSPPHFASEPRSQRFLFFKSKDDEWLAMTRTMNGLRFVSHGMGL